MYSDNTLGALKELTGSFVQQALRNAAKTAVQAAMPAAVTAACSVTKAAQANQISTEADIYKNQTESNAQEAAKGLEGHAGDAMTEAFEECRKATDSGTKTGIDSIH